MTDKSKNILYKTCWAQGIYFLITGIWPLLHINSFMAISGPKEDIWLVKTFGIILAAIGMVLISAAASKRINKETFLLAVGAAIVIIIMEVYYVSIGRIWATYLIDAFIELIFVILWTIAFRFKSSD